MTQTTENKTAAEILEHLRERIADGDTSVTADELRQAESGVEFARLQALGQQKREAQAKEQARVDLLNQIRTAIELDLPGYSRKIRAKLASAEKAIEGALQIAAEHNETISAYRREVRRINSEGTEINGLMLAGSTLIAGDRQISDIELDRDIARAAFSKGNFPTSRLELVNEFKSGDRLVTNHDVAVRWLEDVVSYGVNLGTGSIEPKQILKAGEIARLSPGAAEHVVNCGNAEYAE